MEARLLRGIDVGFDADGDEDRWLG